MKKVQRTSQPSAPSVKQLIKNNKKTKNKYDYTALYYGKSYAIGVGKGFAPYSGTLRLRHSKINYKYMNKKRINSFLNIQN